MHGEHNHAPDLVAIQAKRIVGNMKRKAEKSQEATTVLVAGAIGKASTNIAPELPTAELLTRTVARVREKANPQFQTPQSLADLVIPDQYKLTEKGDNFLHHDSGGDKNRFLIFTTDENLDRLARCNIWQCDGTFKTVPHLFTQLYSIHGHVDGKSVPLVFALLPGKTKKLYKKLMSVIKQGREMDPEIIISDFEQAFIGAAAEVFPNSEFHGCYFHYKQSIYRCVQHHGLQTRYGQDVNFANSIKSLTALAFVPEEGVATAYEKLKATEYFQCNKQGDLKEVLTYFESTWIGEVSRNRRTKPRFDISLWNCYAAILNDLPRTNNVVEGWHNGFSHRLNKAHASMSKFIIALKQEQSITESTLENHLSGRIITPRKRRRYINYDERLKRAAMNYNSEIDVLDYIRGQSHNVKFDGI